MARNLEELRKQYNSVSHGQSLRGGGPGRGPGPRAKGKPKNLKKTVGRLLSYVGKYKLRLALVLVCMILTTISTLCGGYLLVPIINRITKAIDPDAPLEPSRIAEIADGIIESFASTRLVSSLMVTLVLPSTLYLLDGFILKLSVKKKN